MTWQAPPRSDHGLVVRCFVVERAVEFVVVGRLVVGRPVRRFVIARLSEYGAVVRGAIERQ
jgi:hypothetical protein